MQKETPISSIRELMEHDPKVDQETRAKRRMEERRFAQEEMLERLLKQTEEIREDLAKFTILMTDRVAKVETRQDQNISTINGIAVLVAKHTESLSWIKGAGFAAVTIFSILIVWILNHLMFKTG